jgi:hypothetical protein
MVVDGTPFRLPLLIATDAIAISEYLVLDFNHRVVRTFDTLEEADAFVAESNGTDAETVRRDTHDRARMLDEYRHNLKRANPKNSLSCPGGDSGG